MRFRSSGAALAFAAALLACAPVWAGPQSAVWVPKELNFVYRGFTTRYSCDGLQERMRRILLQLGARDDLKVMRFGCLSVNAPETTPGVRIIMHVLQPASATAAQTVAAQWKTVDLADRDPYKASLDCQLIAQLDREVLPLFATRQVDFSAACPAYTAVVGGTRLKADVLVADSAPPATAAR
jgi:hypothetical protein